MIKATPEISIHPKQALANAISALQSKAPDAPPRPSAPGGLGTRSSAEGALAPMRTMPQDIAAAKLSGSVRAPIEEKKIAPSTPSPAQGGTDPAKPKIDPYREPTR